MFVAVSSCCQFQQRDGEGKVEEDEIRLQLFPPHFKNVQARHVAAERQEETQKCTGCCDVCQRGRGTVFQGMLYSIVVMLHTLT